MQVCCCPLPLSYLDWFQTLLLTSRVCSAHRWGTWHASLWWQIYQSAIILSLVLRRLLVRCTLEPAKTTITTSKAASLKCSKTTIGRLLMLLHASEHIRLWLGLGCWSAIKLSLWPATVHIRLSLLLWLLLWGSATAESCLRPLILRLLLLWESATLCHSTEGGRVHRPWELLLLL